MFGSTSRAACTQVMVMRVVAGLSYTDAIPDAPCTAIDDHMCFLTSDYGAPTIAHVIMLCLLWCIFHML